MSQNITNNQRPTLNAIDSVTSIPFPLKGTSANGALNVLLTNDVFALSGNITQIAGNAVTTAATGMMKVGIADGTGTALTSTGAALDVNIKSGITGYATAANQATEITSLASIVTNTTGLATTANQTNGNQLAKITNGTNVADVVAGDTGFNGLVVAPAVKTLTFTTSIAGAQTLLANTDIRGYSYMEIVYTSVGAGLALTGQFSTASGGTYVTPTNTWSTSASAVAGALGVTAGVIYSSPVRGNFFQLVLSALTSGTFTGTLTLRAVAPPPPIQLVSPSGTFTVAGNKTNNNAVPGATNVGALVGLANAAQQTWTEGDQVLSSVDLHGNQRTKISDAAGNDRGANVTVANALVVDGSAVTQPVSGTFWQATQPVSGTVTTTPPANASTNIAQINAITPLMGNGLTGTGSLRVTIASDNTAFAVNSTLSAETTKVIGTVNVAASQTIAVTNTGTFVTQSTLAAETSKVIGTVRTADGSGNLYTSNSTTYTAKNAQDSNLLGTLGTAFSTAGKVDIKGADGDVFVRQATGTNLHAVIDSGTITAVTAISNALPAGTNVIGHVIADSGSTTAVSGTVTTKDTRSATPAQTSLSVTSVNTSVLASNASRLGATVYNEGTAICYLKLGATASTTSYSVQVASGGYYEVPFNYTGAIDGITSASTAQLRITELT